MMLAEQKEPRMLKSFTQNTHIPKFKVLPDCGVPSCCWGCEVEAVRVARAENQAVPVRLDRRRWL